MKYHIEIVCSGNNGRSPMAEAIGNKEVREKRIKGLIFTSSGTLVSESRMSYERASQILDKAEKIGFLEAVVVNQTKYEDDKDYRNAIEVQARNAKIMMWALEKKLRTSALMEIGISDEHVQRQITPSSEISLILGVEQSHADFARNIYAAENIPAPGIFQISEYAGVELDFPNPLGSAGIEVYRDIRDKLAITMHRVVERFRREHRL